MFKEKVTHDSQKLIFLNLTQLKRMNLDIHLSEDDFRMQADNYKIRHLKKERM